LKRKFATVDLSRVKTISLARRKSLASSRNLAGIPSTAGATKFFDSLPRFLKADDFKALIQAIISARRKGKPVIIMAGGHLIKVGLNPVIIDLMKQDLITGLCLNGAGLIHDAEIAMVGQTSEDVAAGIGDGSFGMSSQTSGMFALITRRADDNGIGLGEAAGAALNAKACPYRRYSLLAACHRRGLPAMIHMAVDTDIVCQHDIYDAAAVAQASHHDFKILAHQISRGEGGGVFINIGSAVILPEVFLKALTVSRNIYGKPHKIVTANFDMISHYRPTTNVVNRPTLHGGVGYNFVGHHELMIPLLAWGLKAKYKRKSKPANNTAKKRR
jgi:hypothetical protein